MATFVAVYDACVLYPAPLRDLLIRLAQTGHFRARWTDRIHDEWLRNLKRNRPDLPDQALDRTRRLIDEAVADVRTFAWELLRVDLTADPPVLTLPPGSGFGFDLVPDTGWNQPVTAAVRRHLPGAAGRRRVIRFLHEEAERMLGKHIGRARSDFQIQIHRIDAELCRQATASCAARRAQLLRATHAAEPAEESTTEESTTDDCSDERLSRLHLLADRLDKLRGTAQPPARDVTP